MSSTRLSSRFLEDLVQTRSWSLGLAEQPHATGDGAILFLRTGPRDQRRCLYEFDLQTQTTRLLLEPETLLGGGTEQLSVEEIARRERQRVAGGGFATYQLSPDGRLVLVGLSGKLYLVERQGRGEAPSWSLLAEPRTEPGTRESASLLDPKFSPCGRWISFVRGRELHAIEIATFEEHALTHGAQGTVTHGQAEFVAQEEMNRFTGYWWSPDGDQVLYQRTDNAPVELFYIANPADPGQKPQEFHYPRAGRDNALVTLWLTSIEDGEPLAIEWDRDAYPYLTEVHWEAHGPATIQVVNRDQTDLLLLGIDLETGQTSQILAIHDDAWVNLHGGRAQGYRWLPSGRFLWTSEQELGWVLELREADGRLLRNLTQPELGVLRLVAADEATDSAWVEAGPLPQRRLYRVGLDTIRVEEVLPDAAWGLHAGHFDVEARLFFHVEATPDHLARTHVRNLADATLLGTLESVAEPPPVELMPPLEFVRAGQHNCKVVLIRPPDFDPSRSWPVIVSVYGGPHAMRVNAARAGYLQEAWMAAQGFVVVTIDGRGSWGYGRAWERPIHRKLGSIPLEDQADALEDLAKRYPFLDLGRVGIYGWSFGGYLSAMAVLRRPDLYKAAVAGAPVSDWALYDTFYTERYMGLPQHQPEAYHTESLTAYAKDLVRPLMLVHGTADDNVYLAHSLKLCDDLVRAGRRFDLVPLAGQTHRIHDPVLYRREWELIADFFHQNLTPDKA